MPKAAPPLQTHPSPHRDNVSLFSLFYGLIAPPAAWIASQIACSTLAQEACFPTTQPLVAPAFSGLHLFQGVALALSVLVSASATAIALGAWRSTRRERQGDQHALLEIGEGRTRFMAFAGVLTGLGFMTASLFSVVAVVVIPVC